MSRFIPVDPDKWAEMVLALSEVTRLKAEVERAKAQSDVMHDAKNATIQGLVEERDELIDEVKRLRAAGDALELFITYAGFSVGARSGLIKAWNAAKERKHK